MFMSRCLVRPCRLRHPFLPSLQKHTRRIPLFVQYRGIADSAIEEDVGDELEDSRAQLKSTGWMPENSADLLYRQTLVIDGVTIVNDRQSAEKAISVLEKLTNRYHAWDTEVIELDLKRQGPVFNGKICCASVFCGSDVDFGNGPRLWIDNLDFAEGTMNYFQKYFENTSLRKVWHNYGFDRHILYNHGINAMGFAGDTMHMARLWDASRIRKGGYSLEGLSADLIDRRKVPIKELFGRPLTRKDGSAGKVVVMPSIEQLQRDPTYVKQWIDYATFDTEATLLVRDKLEANLRNMVWSEGRTMWDFYVQFYVPFGELLTDMERAGIRVDTNYLKEIEVTALEDKQSHEKSFLKWAASFCPDAHRMNIFSDAQIQQLFFAPFDNPSKPAADASTPKTVGASKSGPLPKTRLFSVENTEGIIEDGKKKAKKNRDIEITGFGIPPVQLTQSGYPAVSATVLRALAGDKLNQGDKVQYGTAYNFFGGGEAGKQACLAINSLVEAGAITTLLTNFIGPLQHLVDVNGRVHCSMNLNTETGRLSARRPNLQNQPALEKDRYKIRNAFTAEPGKTLIVADYGQLELRVLAIMTGCRSMINAFKLGGDFHSRTAMGMYPEIQKAIDEGKVILEWDKSKGTAPAPLLKDVYASERRKAKILNFSIAYGKTAMGLAKDWGVSIEEARDTVDRWYQDRPEVKEWQESVKEEARRTGKTRTLMGRYRPLQNVNATGKDRYLRARAERAAINTPIQGGAADVVMMSMLSLHQDPKLRDLGYKLLLQIHDEVILEGPEENGEEALNRVRLIMEHPFKRDMSVDFVVDAKSAKTWYLAK